MTILMTKLFFKKLSDKRTFSLLEVLVATMVLFIAIMGLSSTLLTIANLNDINKETSYAMNQGRKLLEEIRATKFDNIRSSYDNKNFFVFGLNPQTIDVDGFVGKSTVLPINNDPELLEVTVRLDWRGKRGNQKLNFVTRIAKTQGK